MTQENESWQAAYLRILEHGPRGEDDWPRASELIAEGFAKGKATSNIMKGGAGFLKLDWEGPTSRGHDYAHQLRKDMEGSLIYYSKRGLLEFAYIVVITLIAVLITQCVG